MRRSPALPFGPALLVLAALVGASALGGCSVFKKPSPYQGALRFEVAPVQRAGAPVRLGIQNDSPRTHAFHPCSRLHVDRFDGFSWVPVRGYRACTQGADVQLEPGQSTAYDLAPLPAGRSYRVLLLAEGESVEDVARHTRVQSSNAFDVVR